MRKPFALTVLAALALSACSLTPVYQRPELAVPAQWPAPAAAAASAAVAASAADSAVAELPWRRYFTDTRLQGLIQLALDNNRDLRVAVLNIEQLRAAYQVQNADRLPTLNGAINGTRQPATSPPFNQVTTVTGGVQLASYELDLFGRVKALSEAAGAQLMASQEARRAAHIALVASVANAYYTLWADRWQLSLAQETLQTRQASLQLLQLKFDNGVLNELDLRSAQSLVEAARVTLAQTQRQIAFDASALDLLLGKPAPAELLPPPPTPGAQLAELLAAAAPLSPSTSTTTPDQPASGPTVSPSVAMAVVGSLWRDLDALPVGLSSQVLLQRPDIAQAEQQLIAANANIGAARAARFPRITLVGSAGVVSDSLSGLFNDGRTAWTFAPSVTLPIFDAGRTQAGIDSANVKRDIALAQYDKAIQSAFKDVADALVARSSYTEQARAQFAQTQAEAARMRLSGLRYNAGVASQLDLLDAQRALFASQQALIQAQLACQQASIGVYRALGGGWLADTPVPASAPAPAPNRGAQAG